jgi:dTDP-glucose 4,6-dehydratase
VQGDICDAELVGQLMADVDAVVHLAAESHVDRSLLDAGAFIQTEVYGTFVLLEAARRRGVERFLHVSTDEVYGQSLGDQEFTERDPFAPRSPYAASKAGGELLAHAFLETYGLPVVIARPANNIGPRQHPEKAIPLFVTNALDDQPLPVYGRGLQVRDRLYVEDNCAALDLLLHRGETGEAYNIAAGNERTNIDVAETVLELLEKPKSLIRFVEDRPGHDDRYRMSAAKIGALGWSPKHDFRSAMERTVDWYRENRWWWEKVKSGQYREYYQKQYGKRLAEATPYEG